MEAVRSFGLVWVLLLLLGITAATGREGGSSPYIPTYPQTPVWYYILRLCKVTEQIESLTPTTAAEHILVEKLCCSNTSFTRLKSRPDRRAGPTAF